MTLLEHTLKSFYKFHVNVDDIKAIYYDNNTPSVCTKNPIACGCCDLRYNCTVPRVTSLNDFIVAAASVSLDGDRVVDMEIFLKDDRLMILSSNRWQIIDLKEVWERNYHIPRKEDLIYGKAH